MWLGGLGLRSGTVVTPDSELRDVRASGRDVVTGPDGLVADRVAVRATVPFHVVAAELGGTRWCEPRSIDVGPDGFRARLSGADVRLAP